MNAVELAHAPERLAQAEAPRENQEARLQDLLPIAMVIVGGCEICAERMVERALREGSSSENVGKTLRIIAGMQKQECFAKAVGPDVIARMEKPLVAGRRALENALHATHAGRPSQ